LIDALGYTLAGAAAVAAGAVNALAGGGTLITFPVLVAVGLPAVTANVTSTVALCPGYLGGTLAQSEDLKGQRHRLRWSVPAGAIGGVVGGILLLNTGERLFRALVPFLLLLASGLLALQGPLRAWALRRLRQPGAAPASGQTAAAPSPASWPAVAVGLAAVYGGYFGAGLGVIVLAVLALLIDDSLTRLNALKQTVSLSANVAAAGFFAFSDQVVWPVVLVMAVGALAGGALGGRLAGRIRPETLRWIVVSIGLVVAAVYLVR
jgi:uncharacterized membrane protein YfcA